METWNEEEFIEQFVRHSIKQGQTSGWVGWKLSIALSAIENIAWDDEEE